MTILAIVSPAIAQTPTAVEAPNPIAAPMPKSCALHIWPAATTHTTFQGWFKAGAVDGARRGIKGYPDLGADALNLTEQVRLLAKIDWRAAAGDPTLTVVIHPEPTGSDDDRTRTTRLVADSPACYSEIVITSSLIEVATFSTRSVRILALRKKFDPATDAPINFSSMAQAVIHLPEKAAEADPRIATATQDAFVAAIGKFAVMQSFH